MWEENTNNLSLITVTIHEEIDKGWYVTTSHGEPPRGYCVSEEEAKRLAERHARMQLERTLSLLTAAEDEPRSSGRPRPCGVLLLYPHQEIKDLRKLVFAALSEVS